jgi:hypothetical protein
VGHRERDPAAFTGVDQPLLQQGVAGRRQRLRLLPEHRGHVGGRDGLDVVQLLAAVGQRRGGVGHRPEILPLPGRGPLEARPEETDGQLPLGLGRSDGHVGGRDR